jgi:glycerophosphoryl diester phosphodiesterase
MLPRHATLSGDAVLFAHRGAKAHAKENTIEAFQIALEMGATGLESDIWLTADGIPVLDHDGVVGSLIRRKPISKVDRAELPEHIPTLAEFYEVIDTRVPLSIDVKDLAAFEPTIKLARNAGAEDLLWLCHPNYSELKQYRQDTTAKLICSTRLSKLNDGLERHAQRLRNAEIDGLNMHHSDWSAGSIATVHRFERLALGWDAQYERQIAKLINFGIDGVFSDHVDKMTATAAQFRDAVVDR